MSYELVRKQLLESVRKRIQADDNRINWSREQILEFREVQLQKLLRHVLHHSPYYRERLKKMKKLSDVKPTTKQDVMDNWDDIICIPGLTKISAEDYLSQLRHNKVTNPFFKDYYYITATGGSSGLRGLFVWDLDYFSVVGCAAFRYQYHDEQINPIKGQKKIAALTAPSLIHASTPLFTITLDDESQVLHVPVDINMNDIGKQLNNFQPTHLIGYSSVITELAYQALAGNVKISPQRISTNSEPLEADSREIVRKAWGIEINNMWGSVEMGMAGIESDKHCGLFVSDDLLIIEPVDENFKPVKNSANAKKLLITNLFNFTFPLIRYVVDDAVDIEQTDQSGYRIAKDIEGRSDTWFTYGELKVHPIVFRNILGQEPAVTEYQVEQTQEGAIVRLILNNKLDQQKLTQELVAALIEAGLSSPVIQIETPTELPRIEETGKLKRFIPLQG
jgi:phenylacetate-CoA ligase